MPSDSIAGFLDHAQAVRVLYPEQIEQLIRQPDIPQSDLTKLCEYLLSRGVLTQYQAEAIRQTRGQELNFAGYPIVDVLGPCSGGIAYKALHPSLRTPIELRRLRADWLAPNDNGANYVGRARAIGMIAHPNVTPLLDVGFHRDELYVVIDQPVGALDLETLVGEIGGAMPGFLAAEYGRAVAAALRAAHDAGGHHGDVRPANLVVGPLALKEGPDGVIRRRPSPEATVRLAELGLIPLRPPASQFQYDRGALPYLPPERVDSACYDPRGDIYGLGTTLYFLLTGRAPFAFDDPGEMLNRICTTTAPALTGLRPDLPPEFVSLVERMMEKQIERRPQSAAEVEAGLTQFCRPSIVGSGPAPGMVPLAAPLSGIVMAAPAATPEPAPVDEEWGVDPNSFSAVHSSLPSSPRPREKTGTDRTRTRVLLVLGLLLHLTGISVLIAWALGAFSSTPEPEPTPPAKKDDPNKKGKRPKLNSAT